MGKRKFDFKDPIAKARSELSLAKQEVSKLIMRAFDCEFPDDEEHELSWEEAIQQATNRLVHLARKYQQTIDHNAPRE